MEFAHCTMMNVTVKIENCRIFVSEMPQKAENYDVRNVNVTEAKVQ